LYSVKIQGEFSTAHRLAAAYSEECQENIHGHNFIATVEVENEVTQQEDMVLDFKLLKEVFEPIFKSLDHALILPSCDDLITFLQEHDQLKLLGKKLIIWPSNPTAEMVARWVYETGADVLEKAMGASSTAYIKQVTIQETRGNVATYRGRRKQ